MHRTRSVPNSLWFSLLVGLTLSVAALATPAWAQDSSVGTILLPLNQCKYVQMSKKQLVAKMHVENPRVVQVDALIENPRAVVIKGMGLGTTRVVLTDHEGRQEVFDAMVSEGNLEHTQAEMASPIQQVQALAVQFEETRDGMRVIPVGVTKLLEMSKKQVIGEVINENPSVATVEAIKDNPRAVLVTGRSPGKTKVTLISADKKDREEVNILVPSPRELLLEIVRRTIPTANIDVVQASPTCVMLTGTVFNVESARAIVELTRCVFMGASGAVVPAGGGAGQMQFQVIDNLRVGGIQQVQLEVIVALVNRTETRQLTFSFIQNRQRYFVNSILASPVGAAGAILPAVAGGSALGLLGSAGGAAAGAGGGASTTNLVFGQVSDRNGFAGFLEALRTEGLAKVLAEPRVVTLSGRPAKIVSGGQVPILVSGGTGAPTVDYKDFGTVVEFIPIVLGNGKIHLEVRPQLSAINAANGINIPGVTPTVIPGFDTRSAQVAVQMEDGQTLAIGGLVQSAINSSIKKVPFLGDLPFFGTAFRSVNYRDVEEELLILVTPRLVDPMACHQLVKFLPGRETRIPDDFELFFEGLSEVPRGQRQICPDGRYKASHLGGPTANVYSCNDQTQPCFGNGCGVGGWGLGGCGIGGVGRRRDCDTCGTQSSPPATKPVAVKPILEAPPTPMDPAPISLDDAYIRGGTMDRPAPMDVPQERESPEALPPLGTVGPEGLESQVPQSLRPIPPPSPFGRMQ